MFQLRQFVGNDDAPPRLQFRYIPSNINWLPSDDRPVFSPQEPLSINMEKNWTEWQDVPVVFERQLKENTNTPDKKG